MFQYQILHNWLHYLWLSDWLFCIFLDCLLHKIQSKFPRHSKQSRNSQLNIEMILLCDQIAFALVIKKITWAAVRIAVLCLSISSCTICSIIHGRLIDCSVSLLAATTTGYRAGFPRAPSTPGTVNWNKWNNCYRIILAVLCALWQKLCSDLLKLSYTEERITHPAYLGMDCCCMPSQQDFPHCMVSLHAVGLGEWLVTQTPCRHRMKRCKKAIAKGSKCSQLGYVIRLLWG